MFVATAVPALAACSRAGFRWPPLVRRQLQWGARAPPGQSLPRRSYGANDGKTTLPLLDGQGRMRIEGGGVKPQVGRRQAFSERIAARGRCGAAAVGASLVGQASS